MIKRLSFVLRLTDGCLDRALTGSEAAIWVDGVKYPHEYKPNGYFVVSDLREGGHSVAVKSPIFQTETMTVRVGSSEEPVRYLSLNPSEAYPGAVRFPRITGRAVGVRKIYIMRTKYRMKIAEDSVRAGNTSVRLFCGGARPRLPAAFRVGDGACGETVMLSRSDGELYTLREPFAFPHPRSSAVFPLIRLLCAADGSFFFVVPPEFRPDKDGAIRLGVLLEYGGISEKTEWITKGSGRTELGDIILCGQDQKVKKGG